MRRHRFRSTLTAWIAACAVLLLSIAPTVSHALGGRSSEAWIEICTAAGTQRVQSGGTQDEPGSRHDATHPFEHCPYCALRADLIGPPPAPLVLPPVVVLPSLQPAAFLDAPRTPHAWVAAQPRGPPLIG